MEVAAIDWKNIDSRFVKDDLYEYISAPKWVDFSAPDDNIDDEGWFCRPTCNHPKTAEDFFVNEKRRTPLSNSKLQRSASVSDIPPFGDRNKRDATLKRRGMNNQTLSNRDANCGRIFEDGENLDPNFSTPQTHKFRSKKTAIQSTGERKQADDSVKKTKQMPKLKATLSARNLFSGGGDLLNKVADFCNELKKLATRPRDKACDVESTVEKMENVDLADDNTRDLNDKENERKPLLEPSTKGKLRRKIRHDDDAENRTPISVDVKNIKPLKEEGLMPIRTNPPTPQCFSATRTPPTKPLRPKTPIQERGILQELKSIEKEVKTVDREENTNNERGGELRVKDANALDVFCFLKPCKLSS